MKHRKSNYCSCSTPSNEKSKWFVIVLILALVVALSYPYIFDYIMKPEKAVRVSKGEVGHLMKKYTPGKYDSETGKEME